MPRTVLKVCGGGWWWWWWLRPILVFGWSLDQAEQLFWCCFVVVVGRRVKDGYLSLNKGDFLLGNLEWRIEKRELWSEGCESIFEDSILSQQPLLHIFLVTFCRKSCNFDYIGKLWNFCLRTFYNFLVFSYYSSCPLGRSENQKRQKINNGEYYFCVLVHKEQGKLQFV